MLTPEEKGALLTARTTARSNSIDRLGVPLFCWGQNSAQGRLQTSLPAEGGGITTFPRAPGLAAAWNLSVVRQQGAIFAHEARSIFNQGGIAGGRYSCPGSIVLWGPTVNLNRDPRWGRNGETPSEDPLINGLYGAAYADGAQTGEDPRFVKAIVTLKHWGAYSVDVYKNATGEWHRQSFNAQVSTYDFYDSYARIFEQAVRGGPDPSMPGRSFNGALGVMCSYNAVNGIPACASKAMQTDMLRNKWGFSGYVTGDSDTVKFIFTEHHFTATAADATRAALEAGTDIESWTNSTSPDYYRDLIPVMLRNGSLDEHLVDTALERTVSLRFRAGLFDPVHDQPYFKIGKHERGTPSFAADALDAARQSLTLLQNKGKKLPWQAWSSVAIVGPYGMLNPQLNLTREVAAANKGGTTVFAAGSHMKGTDKSGFAAALKIAAAADYVILALGVDTATEGESKDRLNITLPAIQSELALAILAAKGQASSAVVLFNFGELSTEEILPHTDSLLMAFWPQTAQHIAEAIFGSFVPGGKLPYTIYPNNYTNVTDFIDMSIAQLGRGYRYYEGPVLFPFGFGLSYTQFNISWRKHYTPQIFTDPLILEVNVSNIGLYHGTETVQLYFAPLFQRASAPLPIRQLATFRKVAVSPGCSATVDFVITFDMLSTVDEKGVRSTLPGLYRIIIQNGAGVSVDTVVEVVDYAEEWV